MSRVFQSGGSSVSGGGAGALYWTEGAESPLPDLDNNRDVYVFADPATLTQTIRTQIKIPSGYNPGSQIKLVVPWYIDANSNTARLTAVTKLIRPGQDAIDSGTNQHSSTNAAVTLTVANQLEESEIDLTDSVGEINSVGVSRGDLLLVDLQRGSGSDTTDMKALLSASEVNFG